MDCKQFSQYLVELSYMCDDIKGCDGCDDCPLNGEFCLSDDVTVMQFAWDLPMDDLERFCDYARACEPKDE